MAKRDEGPGTRRPVIVLHGSPFPAAHLAPLTRELRKIGRVIVPDMPGYGGGVPRTRPIEDAQATLEAYLREQGIADVDVVGHGLGAYRGLRLALGSAVRVRRLVALGGFAGLTGEERLRYAAYADILTVEGDPAALITRRALGRRADAGDALTARCHAWIGAVNRGAWLRELEAMASCPDLSDRLAELPTRLLALHGTEDGVVPLARGEHLARCIPGGRVERVPCAHLLVEQRPDAVIPRVQAFLAA